MARKIMPPVNAHRQKMHEQYDRDRTKLRQNWGRSAKYWVELRRKDENAGFTLEDSPLLNNRRDYW